MKKVKLILIPSIAFFVAVFALVITAQYSVFPESVNAQATSTPPVTRLTGYAWSENIGWISFRDGSSPVVLNTDGTLVGYAWSENIGWVQFGGLSGFPTTSYTVRENAKLTGSTMSGWARAIAGNSSDNGGWDGWISLTGVTIQLNSAQLASASPTFISGCSTGGCANGAAWGSDVVGWIDFSGVTTSTQLNSCVTANGTVIPDGSSFTFYSAPNAENICTTEVSVCSNGVLSPNNPPLVTNLYCGTTATTTDTTTKQECVRGGITYAHGAVVSFFTKPIASIGEVCENLKANLECNDGTFLDADGNVNNSNSYVRCINNPAVIEQ